MPLADRCADDCQRVEKGKQQVGVSARTSVPRHDRRRIAGSALDAAQKRVGKTLHAVPWGHVIVGETLDELKFGLKQTSK
jgi:hypothetical protein